VRQKRETLPDDWALIQEWMALPFGCMRSKRLLSSSLKHRHTVGETIVCPLRHSLTKPATSFFSLIPPLFDAITSHQWGRGKERQRTECGPVIIKFHSVGEQMLPTISATVSPFFPETKLDWGSFWSGCGSGMFHGDCDLEGEDAVSVKRGATTTEIRRQEDHNEQDVRFPMRNGHRCPVEGFGTEFGTGSGTVDGRSWCTLSIGYA
jgi:hypothetical protein